MSLLCQFSNNNTKYCYYFIIIVIRWNGKRPILNQTKSLASYEKIRKIVKKSISFPALAVFYRIFMGFNQSSRNTIIISIKMIFQTVEMRFVILLFAVKSNWMKILWKNNTLPTNKIYSCIQQMLFQLRTELSE